MKRLQLITCALGIVFVMAPAVFAGNIGGMRTEERSGNIGGLKSEKTISGNIGGLRSDDITAELQGNIAGLIIQLY